MKGEYPLNGHGRDLFKFNTDLFSQGNNNKDEGK